MRCSTARGIDPAAVEDVIVGCVSQVGEQSFHVGRNLVLASRLPDSVPAVSIDRQCGSSQQSVHFAAQAVMSGTQDVVIAAGVESMTRVPMGTPDYAADAGRDRRRAVERAHQGPLRRHRVQPVHRRRDDRPELPDDPRALDRFALDSHRKAAAATEAGEFDAEIVPVTIVDAEGAGTLHTRATKAFATTPRWKVSGPEDAQARRRGHRRQRQPDLRRRIGGAGGQRARAQGSWPDAASLGSTPLRSPLATR